MKIGVIAGNFDCIHPGYIEMFNQMKNECTSVWVLLQTDPTIERPEKCKPVFSLEERTNILSSLKQVNNIIPYTLESELYDILKKFDTHNKDNFYDWKYVRFLGDDYIRKPFTGDDLDIPVYYLNRDHGWSTTKYKKLIAESLNGKIVQ